MIEPPDGADPPAVDPIPVPPVPTTAIQLLTTEDKSLGHLCSCEACHPEPFEDFCQYEAMLRTAELSLEAFRVMLEHAGHAGDHPKCVACRVFEGIGMYHRTQAIRWKSS